MHARVTVIASTFGRAELQIEHDLPADVGGAAWQDHAGPDDGVERAGVERMALT
jgi:hypothetical protein